MDETKEGNFLPQQIQAAEQEVAFMNAVRLLVQRYGGSVSFGLTGDANTANFNIPEDKMDSFVRDLNDLVSIQNGIEVS